jgi:hypothetical protein
MMKYMTKDSTIIANALSCAYDAAVHVEQHPSKASDTGTPLRTAKHIVTRTLNNLAVFKEIPAQMAAASLLGSSQTFSTNAYTWCFIRPAIANVFARVPPLPERRPTASPEDVDAATDSDSDADEEVSMLSSSCNFGGDGKATIAQHPKTGKYIGITQDENYLHRGKELQHLRYYE